MNVEPQEWNFGITRRQDTNSQLADADQTQTSVVRLGPSSIHQITAKEN